jgi:hypothetical protein
LAEAEDDKKHGRVARVEQDLMEKGISSFEKFNPKSLTKPTIDMVNRHGE